MEIIKIHNYVIKGDNKKELLKVKWLSIKENGKYLLSGISGSGKTTILNHIHNRKPEIIFNKEVKIGYMSQVLALLDGENVYRNITGKLFYKKQKENVDKLLMKVGITNLSDLKNKKLSSFSGGEQQRIGLAKLLLNEFDLLLMDEPLSALDSKTKESINKLYKKFLENKTIIYVTHDTKESKYLKDELQFKEYKIKEGKLNGKSKD